MRRWTIPVLLIPLLSTAGCSALSGRAIPAGSELKKSESAEGITYYLPKPTFTILRKGLAGGKKAIPQYELAIGSVPDSSRRFEVGMAQGVFTSDTFDLKVGTGQTVTSLNSKRTDEFGNTLASLVGVAASVLPLVAKAIALLDDPHILLVGKILGNETSGKEFDVATKEIQSAIQSGGEISEDTLKRWSGGSAKIKEALLEKGMGDDYPSMNVLRTQIEDNYNYTSPKDPNLEAKTEFLLKIEEKVRLYEPVLLTIQSINEALEQRPKESSKHLQRAVVRLQTAVNMALLKKINRQASNSDELAQALGNLKTAISLIVSAKDPLDQKLMERKDVLSKFLTMDLPQGSDNDDAKAYQRFGEEITKVTASLSSLFGSDVGIASEVLPLATEVTSRIEKQIFYMHTRGLTEDTKIQRAIVPLATALVKYANYEAVIIIN